MLSGNGRHRRPRQAPALFVTAGVTGSAIAIPLLGATGAHAADGTTWDKVAQCETGGSWSADNGNGYYGGLQLTQDDWEKYGGLDFAPSADQASRSQQIAVAEKILADRGPGAWPTCGLLSGLTRDSGAARVDTGVSGGLSLGSGSSGSSDSSGRSDSSRASGSSGSSDTSGSSRVGDPGLGDSSQDAGNSGSSGSSSDSASGSESSSSGDSSSESPTNPSDSHSTPGKDGDTHESGATPGSGAEGAATPGASPSTAPNRDDSDNYGQSVGSSALVDTGALGAGRHRGGSAAEDATEGSTAAGGGRHASRGDDGTHTASVDSYTVHTGDSLASIADSLDVHGGWHALYDENKAAIGSDPNHIVAGQSLDVPVENAQN
ncbi:peptidoglycan-binding protein LysM [Streptomyces spiralis]|uniref:Peptidoglycan-binding protein LysM n=1 Tax=Streptomyces spiralis TaxID=66376 RepID=A0A918ZV50_9ACTN|nr:transglycosylase family protein [Streptomyces spiralis]GHE70124.1 peptidoglycan-binding protein LysM [Streptomyces spiralis]